MNTKAHGMAEKADEHHPAPHRRATVDRRSLPARLAALLALMVLLFGASPPTVTWARSAAPAAAPAPYALSVLAAAGLSGGPDAFGYTFDDSEGHPEHGLRFQNIAATGTVLAKGGADVAGLAGGNLDDGYYQVAVPFPFRFYGVDRNAASLYVSTNGFATFDAAGATTLLGSIPANAAPNDAFYPFWDDLKLDANAFGVDCATDIDCGLYVQTIGSAPNRRFIVQWNKVPFFDQDPDEGWVTFQAQLEEATGDIRFEYEPPAGCAATDCERASGGSASIGIESADPANLSGTPFTGLAYSQDEPALQAKANRYVANVVFHAPRLAVSKDCYALETDLHNPLAPTNRDTVTAGQQWICRVELASDNAGDVPNVQLQDSFGAGLTLVGVARTNIPNFTINPVAPLAGPDTVAIDLGTVPGRSRSYFELAFRVDPLDVVGTALGQGEVCNDATILSPAVGDANDHGGDCDLVIDRADLSINKVLPSAHVAAGAPFVYTVIVDNHGPSASRGVRMLDDVIAAGAVSVAGGSAAITSDRAMANLNGAAAGLCSVSATQIECALADGLDPAGEPAPPGAQPGRWTVRIPLIATDTAAIQNRACVGTGALVRPPAGPAGDWQAGTIDPNTADNCDSEAAVVEAVADLAITKADDVALFTLAGSSFDYTVTVTNNGPSIATGVVAIDTLPLGVRLRDPNGALPPPPITVVGGGTCTSVQGVAQNVIVQCNLGDMAAATARTIVLRVTTDPALPAQVLINRAEVQSRGGQPTPPSLLSRLLGAQRGQDADQQLGLPAFDPNQANNVARDDTNIGAFASLRIDKDGSPDPVAAGGVADYRIDVVNTGPSLARNVRLDDVFADIGGQNAGAYVTLAKADVFGGGGEARCYQEDFGGTTSVLCTLGDIAAGQAVRVDLKVAVAPNTPPGLSVLRNAVALAADSPVALDPLSDLTARLDVVGTSQLSVTKVASEPSPLAGGSYSYALTVTNNGPSNAYGVTLVDGLPAGVTFVAVDDARCVGLVNIVACSLGQMAAQQSIRVVVTVDLAAGFGCGAPIVNAALAQWFAAPNSNTPQQAAGISIARSRCEADLIVTKLSKPDGDQIAGQPIEYTVIVDNRGPSVAPSAAVKDLLQSDGTFDILSVDSDRPATCNSLPVAGGGPFPAPPAAGAVAGVDRRYQLDCTLAAPLGVLAADGPPNTGRWILTVRAVAGTAQSMNNVATGVAAVRDPDVSNNQDRTANRVTNGADLRVVKFGKPDGSVRAGGILTYTLLVDNLGPNTATGVALKDVLRSDGTFDVIDVTSDRPMVCGSSPNGLAATGTPANPAAPGNAGGLDIDCRLTASLPPLGVGAGPGFTFPNEGRWTLTMRVRAAQAQTINNVADVLGALEDSDLSNNHAIVEHDVTDVADLSLVKSGPLTVVAGATMAYSITVANAGPSDAANVVVLDRLPNGITVTNAQVTGGGSCTTGTPGSAADRLICHLGTMPALAAGTPKTVLITVAVDPDVPAGTILENDAFVLSDVFDADNANNADFALTGVTASADLGIVKTDAPDPVTAGQALSYNLLITNTGPSTARDVIVTDALPAGTAFVNAGAAGGSCAYASGPHTLHCSLGDLAAGASFAITVNLTVDGDVPNGATLTNTATATSVTSDPVGANNASTAVTTVAARADLSIDKTASGSGVSGSEILYTITVTNHGPSTAQAVQVTEALPPGVTYVWDDDSCAAGGSPCSLGNMAAGALVTFHVAVRVNADAIGVLENSATVASLTPDGTPANNTDIADVTAVPTADLQIMKYSVPAIVTTGEPMVFTLLVQNLGPGLARNVTIDDTFVADAGYTITAIGGATCTPSAGPYSGNSVRTCQLGDMPPFTQRLVTFTVTTTDSTKLTNVAAVQSDAADPNRGNDKADVSNDVRQSADISVDKTSVAVPGPSVVAGQQIRYTMVVRNNGPSRATGVQLWDRLPAGIVVTGYTAVGPSGGPPIGCTTGTAGSAADLFTCNVGALDIGQTATIVATTTVNANLPDGSVVENDALVTADTFDRNPGNNRDTVLDTVATSADLSITKTDSPDPVVAGEPLEYTLTVHNAGPSGAKDVLVSDQLPAGVTFTGATIVGGDGTCSDSPTGLVTCFLGHLDVDQTVRIYLDVVVKATTAAGTLSNGAAVTSSTADPSNVDNGAGATTTVRTLADLSITKRILGVPVAGQPVTYEIVVANGGPSAATGVEVIDDYSANQSYSWDTGNCSVSGVNELTCALGALAVGGSRTYQVTFNVAANAAFQDATNGVTVTSDQADPNPADNAATTRTPIDGISDLRITKFGKPDTQVRQSGLLTYTVLVENLGPSDAGGVVVRDTVASDGNFEVVSVLGATCTPGAGTYLGGVAMDCALPNPLPAFGQASFRMVLRPIEARSINNSASVRSANRDPDASNNVARVEHDVTELADLSVTKTAAPNPAVAGGSIVWTMRVVNNGPGVAENAVLMDRLPSGVVVTGFTA
ncbi:MAG: hypothetical protein ABI780_07630, partial [Ardenticatenales bacterium]